MDFEYICYAQEREDGTDGRRVAESDDGNKGSTAALTKFGTVAAHHYLCYAQQSHQAHV